LYSWLELLDLRKLLSWLPDSTTCTFFFVCQRGAPPSAFRCGVVSHSHTSTEENSRRVRNCADLKRFAFTFSPAEGNVRSMCFHEDATYIRAVVEKLDLSVNVS
jgi:hypothetical protein